METQNSASFYFLAWASFAIASLGSLAGIYFLPVDAWIKGYIGIGYMFTLTTSFVLAKTIRDRHEAQQFLNRLRNAKTEKLLTDFEKAELN